MSLYSINDPKHWLDRAKEARALAEQLNDPEAQRTMLKNADDYERLAQRAGERAAGRWPTSRQLFDLGCLQRGTNELRHSSRCRWSQSPSLPKRSERDCRGSGGERSAGALRLPGRLARCGTPQRSDRMAVGGGAIRPIAGIDSRSGS